MQALPITLSKPFSLILSLIFGIRYKAEKYIRVVKDLN